MGVGVKFDLERTKMCKVAIAGSEEHKDKEAKLLATFEKWDKDNNGFITRDELAEVLEALGLPTGEKGEAVDIMLKEADLDSDGKINYEEMVHWLCRAPHLEDYFLSSVELFKTCNKEMAEMMKTVLTETKEAKEKLAAKRAADDDDCGFDPGELALGLDLVKKMAKITDELRQRLRRRIDEELPPIIKRSFAHHDKDGSGMLTKDESIIFFSNFMALWKPFDQIMSELGSLCESTVEEETPEEFESLAQKIPTITPDKLHEAFKEKYSVLSKEENIEEKMRAAFEVLSSEGQISEAAVVEALRHGLPKNKQLLRALGLEAADCMAAAELASPSLGGEDLEMMDAAFQGMFAAMEGAEGECQMM